MHLLTFFSKSTIPYKKGAGFKTFLVKFWRKTKKSAFLPTSSIHLSILWKQQWVCPSVCPSVCAYIIYFFGFDQISPAKIFMVSLQKEAGFKNLLVKFWGKTRFFFFSTKSSIYLYYERRCLSVRLFVCPCVRTLSISSFFVQFNPKGYF